jgi:hypothetical protein
LADIAARAVVEGCVGETVAAIVAAEQLATATDESVRAVLRAVADEEAQHAELAWSAVGWAIAEGGDEVRVAVGRAFEAAAKQLLSEPPNVASTDSAVAAELEAHGRLTAARIMAVRRSAIADVIRPCAARLLQLPSSGGAAAGDTSRHAAGSPLA